MAVQRIQLINNKRSTAVKQQKRAIAQLLGEGKDEKAMIRVEHIIREDFNMEGFEILELLLELLHERIRQITNNNECPKDLEQVVCSVIWAADNIDVDELKEVKKQLVKKFGNEFAKKATLNEHGEVNPRLWEKLTYREPPGKLVLSYLTLIAESYQVAWTPSPKR
jgi:vacuolar protein sorting-associated protein IST1